MKVHTKNNIITISIIIVLVYGYEPMDYGYGN